MLEPVLLHATAGFVECDGRYLRHGQVYAGADPENAKFASANAIEAEILAMRAVKRWFGCGSGYLSDEDIADKFGGFIAPNGSSSTLFCLQQARDSFAGEQFTVLCSEEAHYSIEGALHTLGVAAEKIQIVRALPGGAMDMPDLEAKLRLLRADECVVLCLTSGTTMLGANDNLFLAGRALAAAGIDKNRSFVHVDGALMAPVLLFASGVDAEIIPRFDLHGQMDSLVFSLHKWLGVPQCGSVVIIRKSAFCHAAIEGVEYTDTDSGTGSRSGDVALAMCVRVLGFDDEFRKNEADRCIKMAADLAKVLAFSGVPAECNAFSITVWFPEPPKDFGFSLARERGKAHVVIMPGVTERTINEFVGKYLKWWHVEGGKSA